MHIRLRLERLAATPLFSLFFCLCFANSERPDSVPLESKPSLTPMGIQLFSRFDARTMTALGVPLEYLATLEGEGRLIDTDTRKWRYLSREFDRGEEFIPLLRKLLFDAGVPQEFLFLAMAESEFKSQALSTKKAAGLWQLMPATARELGLVINDYIDERQDPIKSTEAAIKYLRYLHNATGKWYLAAMAYNCGLGRLNRALEMAGSDRLEILLKNDGEERYLPVETINYLYKIMSLSLAFSNAQVLKSEDREYMLNRGAMDSIVAVTVEAGNSLSNVAKGANMTVDALRLYNRQFKFDFIPLERKEYQVYLPYEKLSYFRQHFKNAKAINSYLQPYIVKKGDTLYSLARKSGTTVDTLKKLNTLKSSALSVNQKLFLPLSPKAPQGAPATANRPSKGGAVVSATRQGKPHI